MYNLNDKEIRAALLAHLLRRPNAPMAALEEVHVCNGNAIADVVAVYKSMHCYEIKGEADSIGRLVRQAAFYNQAFPLITLVTTGNHLRKAMEITPPHWGVILASMRKRGGVKLRYFRGAKVNVSYKPEVALLSLWRSELIEFSGMDERNLTKMNRQKIASLITESSPVDAINERIGKALVSREAARKMAI